MATRHSRLWQWRLGWLMGLSFQIPGLTERLTNPVQDGPSRILYPTQHTQNKPCLPPRVLALWNNFWWFYSYFLDLPSHCWILEGDIKGHNTGHHHIVPTLHSNMYIGSDRTNNPWSGNFSFTPRKAIALSWRKPTPPPISLWKQLVNNSLPLYKDCYVNRGCPQKYDKVWSKWLVDSSTASDSHPT